MTYNQLNDLLQGRCKNSRKLANNTYARRYDDRLVIRLHQTDIMVFTPVEITMDTGGWKTVTTKERLNRFISGPFRIHQTNGVWFWDTWQDGEMHTIAPFEDGDQLIKDGDEWRLKYQAQMDRVKKDQQLRKKIKAYAQLCADAVPLRKPDGGDCWYCHLVVAEGPDKGRSWGDSCKATDHLLSHMDEKYVVPSLVYHAMKERCTPFVISAAFSKGEDVGYLLDVARDQAKRAVRAYMTRQLGLAG